jgi:hypothetical protein
LETRLTPSVTFAAQQTFAAGQAPTSVAVADFNGDGRPDLAVASTGHAVLIGGAIKAGSEYGGYAALATNWALSGSMPADLLAAVGVGGVDSFCFGGAGAGAGWALYGPLVTVFSGFVTGRDRKTLLS